MKKKGFNFMFYSLKGELIHIEPTFAVIECNGVGYKCLITDNTLRKLPKLTEEARLYTYLNIKNEALDLFGFATERELNCFKMLISVSGVGAKVAIAILSALSDEDFAMAVVSEDVKSITTAQGVGKKLAQRIILELKDKLKKEGQTIVPSKSIGVTSASENIIKASNALTVLGYSNEEVMPILSKFDSSLNVEELIKATLKELAGGV